MGSSCQRNGNREFHQQDKDRDQKRDGPGSQTASFFSVHQSSLLLKVGPLCSDVSLAGVEGHLIHCGLGPSVPRAPVWDTHQDVKLIAGFP